MLTSLAVLFLYLALLPVLSLTLAGRWRGPAGNDMPAWAICLSLVATETSTLTIVSVPGVAFHAGYVFVGLASGYLLGRIVVALWFLPLHEQGATSIYYYLGIRFGPRLQRLVSGTFLLTRLLAEGVRLYAGMLPVALLCSAFGLSVPPLVLLMLIMLLTLAYTVSGGLPAVIWSDSLQLMLYLGGGAACMWVLLRQEGIHILHAAPVFSSGLPPFTNPFSICGAVIGGTVLTLASHGTDQLMLQRCLAARTLTGGRVALIASAFVVAALFALLSCIGVALAAVWPDYHGRPDTLFPAFIMTLPPPLRGLLVAGIVAATMGSLSSAINAMAAATKSDFLSNSRLSLRSLMAIWGLLLVCAALAFSRPSGSAVVFGLSVAAYSYGATLGVFLLAMIGLRTTEKSALAGFGTAILCLAGISGLHIGGHRIAFPWLVPAGVLATFAGAGTVSAIEGKRVQK